MRECTFRLYEWSKKKEREKKRDEKVEGKVRKRISEAQTTAECSFDIHLVRGSRARYCSDGHLGTVIGRPELCRGWNVITGKRDNFSFFFLNTRLLTWGPAAPPKIIRETLCLIKRGD